MITNKAANYLVSW